VSNRTRAVLFDLDGTLLDTAPDMAGALNALLLEHALDALPLSAIRPKVSHGGAAVLRLGFPGAADRDAAALLQRLLTLYHGRIAQETQPFDGIPQLLQHLESGSLSWGVVTNKASWLTTPLMEAMQLQRRAGAIVCGDTLDVRKPNPAPLLHAAALMKVAPSECIYVGDAERDMIAARAAGMRSIGARFGYIAEDEITSHWPADGWIDSPLEVLQWL